jgi:Glycosyl hydrolases family 16
MVIAAVAAVTIGSAITVVQTDAIGSSGAAAESRAVARRTGRLMATEAAPAAGGNRAPRGDLPGWRQLFVDDFDVDVPLGSFPSAVSSKWGAYSYPSKDTSKRGTYWPQKVVSVDGGVLTKHVHFENGTPLVAALTPKVPGSSAYGQRYGRYEVRFRADRLTPGYKIAWLLWPDSGTNITGAASGGGGNGEIDWPEMDLNDSHVGGFVHHMNATVGSDQDWFKAPVDIRQWHTYTMEWSPGLVRVLLDGNEVGRTTERIPSTPMHWVLQTETSLKTAPAAGAQINLMIDYVAAWGYAP